MTGIDLWAAGAAAVASCALAYRRHMLRPGLSAWVTAPGPVQFGLAALAISLAMAVVSIFAGNHANVREAVIYSALAAVSIVMVWSLNRNGRTHPETGE